ncbi:vancomycin resistance protein YoaR [Neomicrococcus aestuarii]|uniref:Vancomycin resistance protein YoaR n=1 Tax=Neomicrococcus aestuarii TaxID=556325 RepID=A0A7W8TS35_9MICC|nr:VanW family protein [Neomicrococcus aestuarii]MBB5511845.1 vancomycin resistance protein YoaR [Neomicrococcus aestuarii]
MTAKNTSDSTSSASKGSAKSKKKAWIISSAAVVLVACGYGGAAYALQDQVPRDAQVEGVEVGGLSYAAALSALKESFGDELQEKVMVVSGDDRVALTPEKAGLGLDYEGTLDGLTGFTLDPVALYQRVFGGTNIPLKTSADTAVLGNALETAAETLNRDPKEGKLSFSNGKVVFDEPTDGVSVDLEKTEEAVASEWRNESREVEAVTETVDPKMPASAFTDAREQAEALVSGNITVKAGAYNAVLTPNALANASAFTTEDSKVSLVVGNNKLTNAVIAANSSLKSTARDASVVFKNQVPVVVASRTGRAIDNTGLNSKVLEASTTEARTASVAFTEVQPEVTTAEVKSWGLTKKIVEFATPYPTYDSTRTKNLVAGAKKVTGVIVQPGEVFSLENALGPITTANGFFESGVVEDGFSTTAVGGGLSQISTQLFNVGFLGGMDDVEHRPHSRWFDRYPAGREATLWSGQIDMKWRNTTDKPVLIQTYVTDSEVVSVLWGTKKWNVTVSSTDPYNKTEPETVYNEAEKCVPETGGQEGFTITTTRTRTNGSASLPTDKLTWTYRPWNEVICGEDPDKKD